MESASTVAQESEGDITTFQILRFNAADCIKRTWQFDKSNVSDDVDESVSSFPKNFISLEPSPRKDAEPVEVTPVPKSVTRTTPSAIVSPVVSSGLQLIQAAYSDSESASPSPSPSPGKRRKLSNGAESPLPASSSKIHPTNGYLFGNSLCSPTSSTSSASSSKPAIEKREKPSVKFSVSSKPNGTTFLPRSVELSGKKISTADSASKLSKTSPSISEPFGPKFVNGKSNGVSPTPKFIVDKGDPQPSTSGLQGSSPLVNGAYPRKEMVVNGFNGHKQNGSSSQIKVFNGAIKTERKRVLSERGEAAAKFPIIDRQNLMMTWRDSRIIKNSSRNCGIGLHNYSNDCFLNAVLQAMLHTAPLARYVAEQHSSTICTAVNCFVCALGNHMRHAINSCNAFKPNWIQPHLKRIFPAHISGYQEDAHELFNLLLDALDPPASTKQTNSLSHSSMLDTRPSTPIEQIFGGTLRNQIRCTECMEVFINYERIRELNLGLRMRKRDVSTLSMDELLGDYFSIETFSQYECKKCKRKTQAQRSTRVLRAPNVLLVQLKRFTSFGSKIRTPVNVELTLRLDRFMYQAGDCCPYQLTAVIEHMGSGIDHGHYIAMVRGFDGKTWHLFDDEESRPISQSTLQQRQAYLMVYTKREARPVMANGTNGKMRDPRPKAASYDG